MKKQNKTYTDRGWEIVRKVVFGTVPYFIIGYGIVWAIKIVCELWKLGSSVVPYIIAVFLGSVVLIALVNLGEIIGYCLCKWENRVCGDDK